MPYTNVPENLWPKMDRCVENVMAKQNLEKSRAVAICHAQIVGEKALSDDMLIAWGGAVKALGDGRVGGLGVRFSGVGDTDLEGEYFTAETYYGAHDGDGADCWVHHGFPLITGKQGKDWADHLLKPVKAKKQDMGIWVEAVCDMADEYEQKVYEMVEAGKLGWSSATAGHMRRVTDDGEITRWPIVEFSLTPTPAEPRNRVMTLKAYKALTVEEPRADSPQGDVPKTPPATAATKTAKPPKPKAKRKGGKTVDIRRIQIGSTHYAYKFTLAEGEDEPIRATDPLFASVKAEDVDTFIENALMTPDARALAKVVAGFEKTLDGMAKAFAAQTGAKEPGLYATGGNPATVKSSDILMHDYIKAITNGDTEALKNMGAEYVKWGAKGTKVLGDQTGATGGFLVPEPVLNQLIKLDPEAEIVWPRADIVPMANRTIEVPGFDTTGSTPGETNMIPGVRGYWTETGTHKTETEMRFTSIKLVAHEYSGWIPIKEALLADSAISVAPLVTNAFRQACQFYRDEAFLDGNGTGQPQGVVDAPGTLVVPRQTAGTITYLDLVNMKQHLLPSSWNRAMWIFNIMCYTPLELMQDPAGHYIWTENARDGSPTRLKNFPWTFTEKTPTLGIQGDVILADWSWYYIGDKQEISVAMSEHVRFLQNQVVYKFVMRLDGQEKLPAPIFLKDAANQVSPFVVLGAAVT